MKIGVLGEMGSKNCMNESCRGTTSSDWKKGWGLKSGGFATLCYSCGSAYDNSFFCETFHLEESGWRECRVCRKRVHCGCIASRHLCEHTDFGGIWCTNCVKRSEVHSMPTPIQIPIDVPKGSFVVNGIRDVRPTIPDNRIDGDKFNTKKLLQLTKAIGVNNANSALGQLKQEDSVLKPRQSSKHRLNLEEQCSESTFLKSDNNRPKDGVKPPMFESQVHQSITFSLAIPLTNSSIGMPFPGGIVEGSEQSKSSSQQGQRARHIIPKPPKSSSTPGSETKKGTSSHARVARPPAEGRGRNQLLPRYWPRITDQELQQLSGDLKSRIVPLFEKILSASDAGRIGRLVLPKACAETYFPAINQSEGIPIRIQDIKGKEWTFQFRFWPNNNSRMYVLEGVTPCIQNMQVQAGDTVTFSRIDPGGQLVIGCRRATNNADVQDPQTTALLNGDSAGGTSVSSVSGNGASNGGRAPEDSLQRHASMEKKKARNIKNKRLVMHSDDVMELRITWEEAQELLRPSPTSKPTVVKVEDHEFEEFEEPPVFGKQTVFTARPTGEKEQLAQCDSCSKWRRLPVHVLLPAKWTCSDNIWDSERNSCASVEDINPKDVENIISIYKDSKKRRISSGNRVPKEGEPSGLDALATAAALGDNVGGIAESSVGATTRHPRHRPGCTCIVCIQPPSGKGKHEPTCKCNVCLTVKRRFKTLMMRKKKREAELSQGKDNDSNKNGSERETIAGDVLLNVNHNDEMNPNGSQIDVEEANKGQLDLNCDPQRGDGILAVAGAVEMNLTTVVNPATAPSDVCPAQNEIPIVGPPESVAESEENVADRLLTSTGKLENNHADG